MWPNIIGAQGALLLVLIQFSLNVNAASAKSSKVSSNNFPIHLQFFIFQYIDKTVAEAESALTDADFQNSRTEQLQKHARRRRQLDLLMVGEPKPTGDDEEEVDESAMYNRERFEGDIGGLLEFVFNYSNRAFLRCTDL
jgi:hypothetical protein